MDEDARKHLEFVQLVIARMNGNSFQLKGWAVALTAGLFALSERSNPWFALLAVVPICVFWGLDVFYLRTERSYRELYKHLCKAYATNDKSLLYDMDLSSYKTLGHVALSSVAFSETQLWFYLPLLLSVGAVVTVLKLFAHVPAAG